MRRTLLVLTSLLGLLAAGLGFWGRHEHRRADQAVQARLLAEHANRALSAQVEADQKALEEERRERAALDGRLRQAGLEANRIRREGEARVQRLLLEPVPSDPSDLVAWAAGQAQDLNRRLEVP